MADTAHSVITPEAAAELALLAARIAPEFMKKFAPERTGGYLRLCDPNGKTLLLIQLVDPWPEKVDDYIYNTCEKIERLREHPEHVLSSQTRDVENKRWAGAIRLPNGYFISFSGFPDMVDEVFCMCLARLKMWVSIGQACQTMSISGNQKFFKQAYREAQQLAKAA